MSTLLLTIVNGHIRVVKLMQTAVHRFYEYEQFLFLEMVIAVNLLPFQVGIGEDGHHGDDQD